MMSGDVQSNLCMAGIEESVPHSGEKYRYIPR